MSYPASVIRWKNSVAACQVCFAPHWHVERTQVAGLALHHLVGRKRRCDERYALLIVCPRDHDCFHSRVAGWPALTLGMLLGCKRETDRGHWRPKKLRELYCRALPGLEPLPEAFMRERARWRPFDLPESA